MNGPLTTNHILKAGKSFAYSFFFSFFKGHMPRTFVSIVLLKGKGKLYVVPSMAKTSSQRKLLINN